MTNICLSKLAIIGSDNGLLPDRRQAIIWINAEILLNRPLGTNFSEILIELLTFSFKKMHLKRLSAKRRPFCLGLYELTHYSLVMPWQKGTPVNAIDQKLSRKKKLGQRDPKTGSTWLIIKRPHKKSASFGTQTFSDNRWKPQIAPNPKLRPHPNLIISKDTPYKQSEQSLLFSGTGLKT